MKTSAVSFKVSKATSELITKCVVRHVALAKKHGATPPNFLEVQMDLTACHANGCEMDWQRLLDADDFNFAHDVCGITNHINRKTGELEDCFLPRCSI